MRPGRPFFKLIPRDAIAALFRHGVEGVLSVVRAGDRRTRGLARTSASAVGMKADAEPGSGGRSTMPVSYVMLNSGGRRRLLLDEDNHPTDRRNMLPPLHPLQLMLCFASTYGCDALALSADARGALMPLVGMSPMRCSVRCGGIQATPRFLIVLLAERWNAIHIPVDDFSGQGWRSTRHRRDCPHHP